MTPQSDLAEAARRPARAARWSPRWRGAVRLAVLVGFLGALGWSLGSQWASVRPLLGQLSVRSLAAALAAVLAGILATFLCWRAVLADLGGRLPVVAGARVFFLGQLGKYLPGSVWPVIAQMELGRDYGVPERASGAAVGAFLLVVVGTGLAVAAVTAPLLGPDALHSYWWLLAVLPVALVAVAPPVLNWLLGVALRLVRRPPLPVPLSIGGVLRAAGWALVSWLAYGAQIWMLAAQFGAPAGLPLILRATGAFAAAWCVGFLLVVAPAGAGVREAALVLLLGGVLARPEATVVAVASRLLFVLGDLGWSAAALLVGRRSARPGRAARPRRWSRGTGW
jgi:glycosyltransferase 2 family protein